MAAEAAAAGGATPAEFAGAAEAAAEAEAAAALVAFFVALPPVCAKAGAIANTGTTRATQSVLSQRILDPFFRLPVPRQASSQRGRNASILTRPPVYSAGHLKCNA
jgi:hypothetical protein